MREAVMNKTKWTVTIYDVIFQGTVSFAYKVVTLRLKLLDVCSIAWRLYAMTIKFSFDLMYSLATLLADRMEKRRELALSIHDRDS